MGRKKKEVIEAEAQEQEQAVENVAEVPAVEAEEAVEEVKPVKAKKPRKYEGEYVVDGVKSWLNVRNDAGKDKKIIGKLLNGMKVTCEGDSKKDADGEIWLEVNAGDTFGYCMLNFLQKL